MIIYLFSSLHVYFVKPVILQNYTEKGGVSTVNDYYMHVGTNSMEENKSIASQNAAASA